MDLDEYIELLRQERGAASHINMDREGEVAYLQAAATRLQQNFLAVPNTSEPLRVLDIGTTPFTFFIKKAYPHYEVWTLDRTDMLKERCRANGVGFASCDLDDGLLPFKDGFFDVVIFTEVLEHIFRPPSELFRELHRITGHGAKLVLSVPNIACMYNRLKLLVGRTPLPNPDNQMKKGWVHGHGHIHEYTMRELIDLLVPCGFDVETRKWLHPRLAEAFRNPQENLLRKVIKAVYYAVVSVVPSFGHVVYVECRKHR